MEYQAVYENEQITVLHQSDLAGRVHGTLINNVCFTAIGKTSRYAGCLEIRFDNSNDGYERG